MYVSVNTALISNYEVIPIKVELDLQNGLPGIKIIGLADTAVQESYFRVSTALKASYYKIPSKKILINLMPANIPKKGSSFDLALAVSLLKAMKIININSLDDYVILGELSLKGEIRPVSGVLPILNYLNNFKNKKLIIPKNNLNEASLLHNNAIGFEHINELILFANSGIYKNKNQINKIEKVKQLDFLDVVNQDFALRGVEIAITGKHHFLMVGAPGSGKSMIGERIPYIMPKLSQKELIEINSIYSMLGLLKNGLILTPPYRAPHHTTSDAALIGGKQIGEITLAHNGILFLDELSEFKYNVLNALREPIEKSYVNISRVGINVKLPSKFLLVSASNPCNCGNYLDNQTACTCTNSEIIRFKKKLNGPLLDRFDIKMTISKPNIFNKSSNLRFSSKNIQNNINNALSFSKSIKNLVINQSAIIKLKDYFDKFNLTARNVNKTLSVAKTIALLAQSSEVNEKHIIESMQYTKPLKWVDSN